MICFHNLNKLFDISNMFLYVINSLAISQLKSKFINHAKLFSLYIICIFGVFHSFKLIYRPGMVQVKKD
ncbi:hypothetical protein EF513_05805 [Rickettsiales endosymbiont of Stachyamoeba lipophora]|nr:hypothetical protein EF513_05805 [Rickettsiales endosymbiont of Stachyamoeba lipophora]